MEVFYSELAVILDADSVGPEDTLRQFEAWDSLTALSICAMIDAQFSVSVGAADLERSKSIGDLAAIVSSRLPK